MNRTMSKREHAQLAGELIEACGGLDEIQRAFKNNPLRRKTVLSDYQNPDDGGSMPADVIAELEAYCRRPVYSSGLAARVVEPSRTMGLVDAACSFAEESSDVQRAVRVALSDGRLTPREMDDIASAEAEAVKALENLRGVLRALEATTPTPTPLRSVS